MPDAIFDDRGEFYGIVPLIVDERHDCRRGGREFVKRPIFRNGRGVPREPFFRERTELRQKRLVVIRRGKDEPVRRRDF